MPGAYANCGSVASGASATCDGTNMATTLQSTCVGASVEVMCPAQNGDSATVPFVKGAGAVSCQACALRTAVTDVDPRVDTYWVEFAFGRNMNSQGTIDESNLVGYNIQIVDAHGYKVADT